MLNGCKGNENHQASPTECLTERSWKAEDCHCEKVY
jgi:hypothetical protein